MTWQAGIEVGVGAVAFASAVAGVFYVSAFRAMKDRADALAAHLAEEKAERLEFERDAALKAHAQEMRCTEEMGQLRGKLDAVTSGWANELGDKIGDRIVEVIAERLG